METSKIAIEHMRMEMRRDQSGSAGKKKDTHTTVTQEERQQHVHKANRRQRMECQKSVYPFVQSLQM